MVGVVHNVVNLVSQAPARPCECDLLSEVCAEDFSSKPCVIVMLCIDVCCDVLQ
jgi:hypothetical protein